jgi:N4-gp56 family major capsid protein
MVATADMAFTAARAGLTPTIWQDTFFDEYVRTNQFSRYMGASMSNVIQLNQDLTRKTGDSIVFATMRRLVGAGVTGNTMLRGNEELINMRSLKLTVDVIRHAVAVTEWDEQKSVVDLLNAGRDGLMVWAMEKIRNDIITAMGKITADNDVSATFAAATNAQMDTWLTNNLDRVLFGKLVANSVSSDFSTSIATLDATDDKMTCALLSLAKRRARLASPHIRPTTVKADGSEWFVVFMPSLVFRDLKADPVMIAAQQYANIRGEENPLFSNGDLVWDGMIIREIPELGVLTAGTANAHATIDTARTYLCGAQAIGIGWAQRTTARTDVADYGFVHGAAVMEIRGIEKLRWGTDATVDKTAPKDHGIVTIFTTAVADA